MPDHLISYTVNDFFSYFPQIPRSNSKKYSFKKDFMNFFTVPYSITIRTSHELQTKDNVWVIEYITS